MKKNIMGVILMLVMAMGIMVGFLTTEAIEFQSAAEEELMEDENFVKWVFSCYDQLLDEGYVKDTFASNGYLYHIDSQDIDTYAEYEMLAMLRIHRAIYGWDF